MDQPLYLGIDLGTTNSAAAVYDTESLMMVRNSLGETLTPSVVRIDARQTISVGARARRFLDSDPQNTRAEFKRLMGTSEAITFAASKISRKPEELAAEILRALRNDVETQFGVAPSCAVVSVPALFELPQSNATVAACKLAGFTRVELIQEPVASALAAGYGKDDETEGRWLVYDLGGGTFDASLLETSEGHLRVVGHDGDNFLGGRDCDSAILDWAIGEIASTTGVTLSRANPAHENALRKLKHAAEECKIELTRTTSAALALPELEVDGAPVPVDLLLSREQLDALTAPIIDRSIAVCTRLLAAHNVAANTLRKIVLVGGPTAMPIVRARLGDELGAPIAEGIDPMTIVARGAAIFAATSGLDARPAPKGASTGRQLLMQYPSVSSDLSPHVVGRAVEAPGAKITHVTLERGDGQYKSAEVALDANGYFVLSAELLPRRANLFRVHARTDSGAPIEVRPATITIVQGLTIADPPLSRSIGVALASDRVRTYFERGAPLPARRTFTHQTVEAVAMGVRDSVIKIPIVQGEFASAHLCRMVGALDISGHALTATLPSGSIIEVTLELGRGGELAARAFIPTTNQVFEDVAHLLVPDAPVAALTVLLQELTRRLTAARQVAFRASQRETLAKLQGLENAIAQAATEIDAGRGGDADAAQKARRSLIEIDATLEGVEALTRWPELVARHQHTLTWSGGWVGRYGTASERSLFDSIAVAADCAAKGNEALELERQIELLSQLGNTAYYRDDASWASALNHAASRVSEATDLPRAELLAREGRAALAANNFDLLRAKVRDLWRLLPDDVEDRILGHNSGVR